MKHAVLKTLLTLCFLTLSLPGGADLKQGIAYYKAHSFPESQQALEPEAKTGNAEAQFWLGLAYLNNPRKKHWDDWSVGKNWLLKSANNGNPYAMWMLADGKHNFGLFFGNVKDPDSWKTRAIARWKELAKEGDGDAMAMLAKHDRGINKFIPWLGEYAYKKHLIKAMDMGSGMTTKIYNDTFTFFADAREKKKITAYLLKAAKRGSPIAMASLSREELNFNKKEAFEWAQKCAPSGYGGCIARLYWGFLKGIGVKKNLTEAYKWGLIGEGYNMNIMIPLVDGDKFKSLTPAQKKQAKKEADSFVKTHLPDYGETIDSLIL